METNPTESISFLFQTLNTLSTSVTGGLRRISSPMKTNVSKPALSVRKNPAYRLFTPFSSLTKVKCEVLYWEGNRAVPYFKAVSCDICLNSDWFQLSTRKILKRFDGSESSLETAAAEGRLLA